MTAWILASFPCVTVKRGLYLTFKNLRCRQEWHSSFCEVCMTSNTASRMGKDGWLLASVWGGGGEWKKWLVCDELENECPILKGALAFSPALLFASIGPLLTDLQRFQEKLGVCIFFYMKYLGFLDLHPPSLPSFSPPSPSFSSSFPPSQMRSICGQITFSMTGFASTVFHRAVKTEQVLGVISCYLSNQN